MSDIVPDDGIKCANKRRKCARGDQIAARWLARHLIEGGDGVIQQGRGHFAGGIDIHFWREFFLFIDHARPQPKHAVPR